MKKAYKSKNKEHRIAIINHLISEGGNMVYNTYAYGKMIDYYYIDKGVIRFSEELPTGYVEAFLNEKEAIFWWLRLANVDKVNFTKKHCPERHYKGVERSDICKIYEYEHTEIVKQPTFEQAWDSFINSIEKALFFDKIVTWISKILR